MKAPPFGRLGHPEGEGGDRCSLPPGNRQLPAIREKSSIINLSNSWKDSV